MQIWHAAVAAAAAFATIQDIPRWTPAETLARLNDGCADVRENAAKFAGALGALRVAPAVDRMIEILRTDPFPDVRQSALMGLYAGNSEPVYQALLAALDDPDAEVAGVAAQEIVDYDDDRSAVRLLDLCEHANTVTRNFARAALGALIGRGLVKDEMLVKRFTALMVAEIERSSRNGERESPSVDAVLESMHRVDLLPPGWDKANSTPTFVPERLAYDIPEGYRGFLTFDFDTPGCSPLTVENGRTILRFGPDGHGCTSSFERLSYVASDVLSNHHIDVVARGSGPAPQVRGYGEAPLRPSTRLPSRSTVRIAFFVGSDAELRAARGCSASRPRQP